MKIWFPLISFLVMHYQLSQNTANLNNFLYLLGVWVSRILLYLVSLRQISCLITQKSDTMTKSLTPPTAYLTGVVKWTEKEHFSLHFLLQDFSNSNLFPQIINNPQKLKPTEFSCCTVSLSSIHTSQFGGTPLVKACSRGLLTADGGLSLLTNWGLPICLLAIIFWSWVDNGER